MIGHGPGSPGPVLPLASCEMTEDPAPASRKVKLACRDIWKLYGPRGEHPAASLDEVRARAAGGRSFAALSGVSLDIAEGEIFVVMGLSGSGKSTLLRAMAQLIRPTFGTVELDGRDLTAMGARDLRRVRHYDMGMVFQHFGLLPHLSVAGNIALPLKVRGDSIAAREQAVAQAMELTGLSAMAERLPGQLSGGQQQRVGLARALAAGPGLLFLDEPFSALDPLIRRELQDELVRLQASLHKTMVFVTHDFSEAVRIGDRIAIMKDGRLCQVGTPEEIVSHPADDYVRSFVAGVDLTRVIRCASAARPASRTEYAATVRGESRLHEAAGLLAAGPVGVLDGEGRLLGEVDAAAVLAAVSGNRAGGA